MILKYIIHNKWYSLSILYFLVSIILKMQGVDITIPCIFNFLFDVNCPGCGLTRAFTELIKLNFREAWSYNPIIFIVMPAISYFIISDYFKYRQSQKSIL